MHPTTRAAWLARVPLLGPFLVIGGGLVRAMQQHGDTEQGSALLRAREQAIGNLVERRLRNAAPMRAHQRCEHALFLLREAGDVGVFEHVGAVHVVLAVRDGETQLVQLGRTTQHRAGFGR